VLHNRMPSYEVLYVLPHQKYNRAELKRSTKRKQSFEKHDGTYIYSILAKFIVIQLEKVG